MYMDVSTTIPEGSVAERVVLVPLTAIFTTLLIVTVTAVLLTQRQFETAYHWLVFDWREPI